MKEFRLPSITSASLQGQLGQIKSYLIQLVQQLNFFANETEKQYKELSEKIGAASGSGSEQGDIASLKSYLDKQDRKTLQAANANTADTAAQTLADARGYAVDEASKSLEEAKEYADEIRQDAFSYADQKADSALGFAKNYADSQVSKASLAATAYTDDTADQTLADAQSYADVQASNALFYAKKYADKRIVHNYLDNSDFRNPVNQRGLTSYTAAGYTIDRWVNSTKYGTIKVLSGAVSKSGSGTLYQHIEGLDPAKTYTAAVCLDDGTLNVQSGVLSNTIGSSSKGLTVNYTASTGIATFLIGPGSSAETKYKWAALYEGTYTAETLPPYFPKGYATELAECMRYYYQSWTSTIATNGCLTREAIVSSRLHNVELPIPMRATPTITIYKTDGTANAVGEYLSGTAVTSVSVVYSTNKSFIPAQASGAFKAGTVYAFHYAASADL